MTDHTELAQLRARVEELETLVLAVANRLADVSEVLGNLIAKRTESK